MLDSQTKQNEMLIHIPFAFEAKKKKKREITTWYAGESLIIGFGIRRCVVLPAERVL